MNEKTKQYKFSIDSHVSDILGTLNIEYEKEFNRWSIITKHVLPYIKPSEASIEARSTALPQIILNETAESYMTLCSPATQEWFQVYKFFQETKNDNEEIVRDKIDFDEDATDKLRRSIAMQTSNFYSALEETITSILGFGQAVMYAYKEGDSIHFKNIPQYQYMVYQRDNKLYHFLRKKTMPIIEFKKLYPGCNLDDKYNEKSGGFITFIEMWENVSFMYGENKKAYCDQVFSVYNANAKYNNEDWVCYIMIDTEESLEGTGIIENSVNNKKLNLDSYKNNIVFAYSTNDFNYVYMMFKTRNDTSYGKSVAITCVEDIFDLDEFHDMFKEDVKNKVDPPIIANGDMPQKLDIQDRRVILSGARGGSVQNQMMFFPNNSNGGTLAFQAKEALVAELRRVFRLEDLQFIADPAKRITNENYIDSFVGRLNVVTPLIYTLLLNTYVPLMNLILDVCIKSFPDVFDKDNLYMVEVKPPVVVVEKTLTSTASIDLLIKKLTPLYQFDASVFDVINFDKVVESFTSAMPQIEQYIRTPKELEEFRKNKSNLQAQLIESEVNKNNSLAEKHKAQAQEDLQNKNYQDQSQQDLPIFPLVDADEENKTAVDEPL